MTPIEADERWSEREAMVEHQLRRRGIRDRRVLDAMLAVPRHAFVPPAMRYAATEVSFDGDVPVAANGQLTLRGVTKPVTLAIADFRCGTHLVYRRAMCSAEATATIRRSEFGMTSGLPNVAGDDVRIVIPVEATIE